MVETARSTARADRAAEGEHVGRSTNVPSPCLVERVIEACRRRDVDHAVDVSGEHRISRRGEAKLGLSDVAAQADDAGLMSPRKWLHEVPVPLRELDVIAGTDQCHEVRVGLTCQKVAQDLPAEEARGARDQRRRHAKGGWSAWCPPRVRH